jgi:hypothetical protein
LSTTESFATSGSTSSNTGTIGNKTRNIEKIDKNQKDEEDTGDTYTEEKKIENKRTENNFSKLTTEMFKLQ